MSRTYEVDKALGMALWHILRERGGGDVMQGRAATINVIPENHEWLAGIRYAIRVDPRSPLKDLTPDSIIRYAQSAYAQGLVAKCLDAYWYEYGMPTIELGHKLAASLLLTSIPKEVVASVRLPFKAFRITVPNGLLCFESGDVKHISVGEHISPAEEPPHLPVPGAAFVVQTDTGGSYSLGRDVGDLLSTAFARDVVSPLSPVEAPTLHEKDKLRLELVATLVAGVCLYLTGDRERFPYETTGKGHGTWKGERREPGSAPLVRVFKLTKAVEHNFKEVIQDYCAGRSTKMTVQCIVAGHWRNQACGPRMTERRRIFIEPYWKGPQDAPIALRPHRMKEEHGD